MKCFLKKDGTVKKNYQKAINYILSAKMEHHTITVGRHDDVIDEYDCYTTINKIFYSREKEDMRKKVREICLEYVVMTKEWYSHMDMSINFHGNNDDVERMLNELSKYKQVIC